jgi:hypothetical protein
MQRPFAAFITQKISLNYHETFFEFPINIKLISF